jgi:hypothetical protein
VIRWSDEWARHVGGGFGMNDELDRLFAQMQAIEETIERRLEEHRAQFKYRLEHGKAAFDAEAREVHDLLRIGTWRYLRNTPLRQFAVAPIIYAMVLPLALVDLSFSVYQWICFTAWGIGRVSRRQHVVIDRHRLRYLNAIEKLNCVYCGYGNGVLSYAREIAGRTEQYWCPIRHATRVRGPHSRYKAFVEYGDAEGYRARLESLRSKLR